MNISKTTHNFAKSRNLEITVWANNNKDGVVTSYAVWELYEDNEFLFTLNTNEDGFFLSTNGYVNRDVWQDLPYWIKTEKELRKVLDYVHNNHYNVDDD